MKELSFSEIQNVTGASLSENMVTAAAGIYIGTTISSFAYGVQKIGVPTLISGVEAILGTTGTTTPLSFALSSIIKIAGPALALASGPIAIAKIFEYSSTGE